MELIKLINFKSLDDDRGGLTSLETPKDIPFDIKRTYFIYGTKKGVSRGFHAHKELQQVAVCITGNCRFILDDGNSKEEVILSEPSQGLFIDKMQWREMHDFSEDCVLLVLASHNYDEDDYIRDYSVFNQIVSKSL
jgi:dTDP-4-dehydrorhamnose 3,5-epimerase-like enzyme